MKFQSGTDLRSLCEALHRTSSGLFDGGFRVLCNNEKDHERNTQFKTFADWLFTVRTFGNQSLQARLPAVYQLPHGQVRSLCPRRW